MQFFFLSLCGSDFYHAEDPNILTVQHINIHSHIHHACQRYFGSITSVNTYFVHSVHLSYIIIFCSWNVNTYASLKLDLNLPYPCNHYHLLSQNRSHHLNLYERHASYLKIHSTIKTFQIIDKEIQHHYIQKNTSLFICHQLDSSWGGGGSEADQPASLCSVTYYETCIQNSNTVVVWDDAQWVITEATI